MQEMRSLLIKIEQLRDQLNSMLSSTYDKSQLLMVSQKLDALIDDYYKTAIDNR